MPFFVFTDAALADTACKHTYAVQSCMAAEAVSSYLNMYDRRQAYLTRAVRYRKMPESVCAGQSAVVGRVSCTTGKDTEMTWVA